ncbi:DUF4334 domain-containing protein [Pararhizobium sp. LjRoot235]|uniref:DUF4334 domain-containing protein n=1 Tax=Pararhizobium sp. LjRoot235 TaxID=3342291 RepID=UPI003F50302D
MVKSCRLPLGRAERTELQCAKNAAMTYDRQPIIDYFHQADHPTILGLMREPACEVVRPANRAFAGAMSDGNSTRHSVFNSIRAPD